MTARISWFSSRMRAGVITLRAKYRARAEEPAPIRPARPEPAMTPPRAHLALRDFDPVVVVPVTEGVSNDRSEAREVSGRRSRKAMQPFLPLTQISHIPDMPQPYVLRG